MLARPPTVKPQLFQTAVNQFKDFLLIHDRLREENNTDKKWIEIVGKKADLREQYNAILIWCNQSVKDEFSIVREKFLEFHDKHFSVLIKEMLVRNNQQINDAQKKMSELNAVIARDLDSINEHDEKYKKQITVLKEMAKKVSNVGDLTRSNYQASMSLLKQLREECKNKMFPVVPAQRIAKSSSEFAVIDVVESHRAHVLAELDSKIQNYKNQLKSESILIKIIYFFSPTRWKRKKSLKEYDKRVGQKSSSIDKYRAAEQWFKDQERFISSDGRFATQCLIPFRKSNEQFQFESLPYLSGKQKAAIEYYKKHHDTTQDGHNQRIDQENSHLTHLHQQVTEVHVKLTKVFNSIDKIQQLDSGYSMRFGETLQKERVILNNLIKEMKGEQLKELAYDVVSQIRKFTPLTSKNELENLKKVFAVLENNKEAVALVRAEIQRQIEITIKQGGKIDDQSYMGTTLVKMLVESLGSKEQKTRFKKLKPELERRKKETFINLEKKLVQSLEENIATGDLLKWFDEHQRDQFKKVYSAERGRALSLHQNGKGQLKEFIDRQMRPLNPFRLFSTKLLPERYVRPLVYLYGTQKQWEKQSSLRRC